MDSREDLDRRAPRQRLRTALLVAAGAIVVLLAALNTETVTVNWIVGSGGAPLVLVVAVSFLLGVVCCYLVERLRSRRR